MLKRLLIFGGGGFVGGNLTRIAQNMRWKVSIADSLFRHGVDHTEWIIVDFP